MFWFPNPARSDMMFASGERRGDEMDEMKFDIAAYRKFIVDRVKDMNEKTAGNYRFQIRLLPFTDADIERFLDTRIPEKDAAAVRMRFSDPQATYREIAKVLGVSGTRARQRVMNSFSKFLRPENGFVEE